MSDHFTFGANDQLSTDQAPPVVQQQQPTAPPFPTPVRQTQGFGVVQNSPVVPSALGHRYGGRIGRSNNPALKLIEEAIIATSKGMEAEGYQISLLSGVGNNSEVSVLAAVMEKLHTTGKRVTVASVLVPNLGFVQDKVKYPRTATAYMGAELSSPTNVTIAYVDVIRPHVMSVVATKYPDAEVIDAGSILYNGTINDEQLIAVQAALIIRNLLDRQYAKERSPTGYSQVDCALTQSASQASIKVDTPTTEPQFDMMHTPLASDLVISASCQVYDTNTLGSTPNVTPTAQSNGSASVMVDVIPTNAPTSQQLLNQTLEPYYLITGVTPPPHMANETGVLFMIAHAYRVLTEAGESRFENIISSLAGRAPGWAGDKRIHPHVGTIGYHNTSNRTDPNKPGAIYTQVHGASGASDARNIVREFVRTTTAHVAVDTSPLDASSTYMDNFRLCGLATVFNQNNQPLLDAVTFINELAAQITGSRTFTEYAANPTNPVGNPVRSVLPVLIGTYTVNGMQYPLSNLLNYFTMAEFSSVDTTAINAFMESLSFKYTDCAIAQKHILSSLFGQWNPKVDQIGTRLVLNGQWWAEFSKAGDLSPIMSARLHEGGLDVRGNFAPPQSIFSGGAQVRQRSPWGGGGFGVPGSYPNAGRGF